MIGRLIRVEFATVRRSFVVWLALLLVIGGSVVARTLTWLSHALGRSQIGSLLLMNPISGWSDAAIPLMLLAYLIVTAYLFGRDFEDGNADLTLTAPVPRGAVVIVRMAVVATGLVMISLVGWAVDVAMRALLATSAFDPGEATSAAAVLGASIAAIATLPLVAWAAIRSRGVLPALGLGIGLQVSVRVLAGFAPVRLLPWFLPTTLAAGGVPSWSSIALALLLFAGGLAATVRGFRNVDLYE